VIPLVALAASPRSRRCEPLLNVRDRQPGQKEHSEPAVKVCRSRTSPRRSASLARPSSRCWPRGTPACPEAIDLSRLCPSSVSAPRAPGGAALGRSEGVGADHVDGPPTARLYRLHSTESRFVRRYRFPTSL
jgi:hypothetical protein